MKRDKIKEKSIIEEFIKQGKKNSEIAKELRITINTLRGRMRTYKLVRFNNPLTTDNQKIDIVKLYNKGLNCTEIGKQFNLSRITISKILKESGEKEIRHASEYSKDLQGERKCDICEKNTITSGLICGTCRTNIRRHNIKAKLMDLKGGKCYHCGNSELDAACYDFHHLDKDEKDFNLSTANVAKIAWEKIKLELNKCILICSNCHRAIHTNIKTNKFLYYAEKHPFEE